MSEGGTENSPKVCMVVQLDQQKLRLNSFGLAHGPPPQRRRHPTAQGKPTDGGGDSQFRWPIMAFEGKMGPFRQGGKVRSGDRRNNGFWAFSSDDCINDRFCQTRMYPSADRAVDVLFKEHEGRSNSGTSRLLLG